MPLSIGQNLNTDLSSKVPEGNSKDQTDSAKVDVSSKTKTHSRSKSDSAVHVTIPKKHLTLSPQPGHGNLGNFDSSGFFSIRTNTPTTGATTSRQKSKGSSQSPRSMAKRLHIGNITGSDSRSTTPDHLRMSQSFSCSSSRGSVSPDSFTYQTKYLVLQFLHQATNEEHLLQLSQNSMSTTSESEHRSQCYADTLRQQWAGSRSKSSPSLHSSNQRRSRSKASMKTKASSTTKTLSQSQDSSQHTWNERSKKGSPQKATKAKKKVKKVSHKSTIEGNRREMMARSVSQNTENSEHETYDSDADDELDTSFNSSHQGSVTSLDFRKKLTSSHQQMHSKRLPTVQSDSESVGDVPSLNEAQASTFYAYDDETASSILSLDMISLEQQPVSPTTQYARVTEYLLQMSQASVDSFQFGDPILDDATDSSHHAHNAEDREDPCAFFLPPNSTDSELLPLKIQSGEDCTADPVLCETSDDEGEDMERESDDQPEDEIAWEAEEGAVGPVGAEAGFKLDLADQQDAAFLIHAAHSLQQEIEEEMFSLESEYEEALQSMHSDHSCPVHAQGLSQSCSFNAEVEEAVRILTRIGDEVQQRHFAHLDKAVAGLLLGNCAEYFTYENFRKAALQVLKGDLHGWEQVATLLLYSQHVALHVTHTGREGLRRILNYTVQLLTDKSSDFVVRQGGWSGITSSRPGSEPSSPELPGPVLDQYLDPYCSMNTSNNDVSAALSMLSLNSTHDSGYLSISDSVPESLSSISSPNETLLDTSNLTMIAEETSSQIDEDSLSLVNEDENSLVNDNEVSVVNDEEFSVEIFMSRKETFSVHSSGLCQSVEETDGIKRDESQEAEREESSGTEGLISNIGDAAANSSLLARCAVSVGFLALGAVVAFRLARAS